eukprot:4028816-Pyramimonas_sp.AAC.1
MTILVDIAFGNAGLIPAGQSIIEVGFAAIGIGSSLGDGGIREPRGIIGDNLHIITTCGTGRSPVSHPRPPSFDSVPNPI